jgi:outer membrane protein
VSTISTPISFRTVRRLAAPAALTALALTGSIQADADARAPFEVQLDALVQEATAATLELAGARATVAQRLAEVDEARARFKPALDVSSRYSRADGGRTIDLPVGDLLNPVYSSLTQLGGPAFAPIANQEIELLRGREQDTRVTLTQSIYDARIAPGVEASRGLQRSAAAATDALRARVARDVRQGYYAWLAARDARAILDDTLELARANLRTNQSLLDHGRVTRDLVLRAEADLLEIEQQRRAAASAVTLAASYVNVLRRAPLDRELPSATLDADGPSRTRARLAQALGGTAFELASLTELALARRAELAELDAAVDASVAGEDAAKAAYKPRVGFALDAGIQGERYGWGDDERFVQASVIVQFGAYSGGANSARVRASRAATDALSARREQTALAIRLEVHSALEALEVAEASLDTASRRVAAADAAFVIVSRKRDLGQINQTEFVDARNTLTAARLNLSRTRADALARLAEVGYAVGQHE